MSLDEARANAELIVTAVNAYSANAAKLEALTAALRTLDWAGQVFEKPLPQVQIIAAFKKALTEGRAALALIESPEQKGG